MSLDNAIVLHLSGSTFRSNAGSTPAIAPILDQIERARPVIVVPGASPTMAQSAVARASRLPATVDIHVRALASAEAHLDAANRTQAALTDAGVRSTIANHAVCTRGNPLDARPRSINASRIAQSFRRAPVLIATGAVGRDNVGPTFLGSGGSTLTALFIASRLGIHAELIRSEEGLPPRTFDASGRPARYLTISHEDAIHIGADIASRKALLFARESNVPFTIRTEQIGQETLISRRPTSVAYLERTPMTCTPSTTRLQQPPAWPAAS